MPVPVPELELPRQVKSLAVWGEVSALGDHYRRFVCWYNDAQSVGHVHHFLATAQEISNIFAWALWI